jgi:hypothetical protein
MPHKKTKLRREKLARIQSLKDGSHQLPKDYPIPAERLAELEQQIFGKIVYPGDPDYDAAKTEFNPAYPAFPIIIIFCACLGDVRASLELARQFDIWAVARAGRHSLAGYSVCDGMVIDVSAMDSVIVDPVTKTATVGAGLQFAKFNAHLQSYGLHVPGGGCPTVCVAGYMQGGGYGFTTREFGIHSDNVLAFKMVLADGQVVTANENQNSDLYWAVRGGTGNQFGILIEITYRLYELGKIWGIKLEWPSRSYPEEAAQALLTIQDAYINSPDLNHLGFQTVLGYDTNYDDELRVIFCGVFNGDEAAFEAAIKPLMDIGHHQVAKRMYDHYSTVDETLLEGVPDIPGPYVKGMSQSCYLAHDLELTDWRDIIEFVSKHAPNHWTTIDMEAYGGQASAVPQDASAFIHRDVKMDFFCDVFWDKDEDKGDNVKFLQDLMVFMKKYSNGHSFQNYPCRLQEDWKWAYFGRNYPSLVWVKQKYDPSNFFHYQQSITAELDEEHMCDYAKVLFDDPVIVYDNY